MEPVDPFKSGRGFTLTQASKVTKTPMKWLWGNRWPLRGMTLLGGLEGTGKSVFLVWQIAALSMGRLPGQYFGTPITVVVVAFEDDWSSLLVPRLEAAGADLERIFLFTIPKGAPNALVMFPEHLTDLTEACQHCKARATFIDPFLSHLSLGAQANKDYQRTSMALALIRDALDLIEVSILGTIHPNKNTQPGTFLNSLWGSRGLTASARAVQAIVRDPENESHRLILQPKNNGGMTSPAISTPTFEVIESPLTILDENDWPMTGVVVTRWSEDREGIRPDDFLGSDLHTITQIRDAMEAIVIELGKNDGDGCKPNEVVAAIRIESKDLQQRTIERAYQRLVSESLCAPNLQRRHGVWKLTAAGDDYAVSLSKRYELTLPVKADSDTSPVEDAVGMTECGLLEAPELLNDPPFRHSDTFVGSKGVGLPEGVKRVAKRPAKSPALDDDSVDEGIPSRKRMRRQ